MRPIVVVIRCSAAAGKCDACCTRHRDVQPRATSHAENDAKQHTIRIIAVFDIIIPNNYMKSMRQMLNCVSKGLRSGNKICVCG